MTTSPSNVHYLPELWMELKDPEFLRELMEEHHVTRRRLAEIAGWKSHGYVNKLLAGKAKTLKTDPALRIAYHFKMPPHRLFVTRVSGESAHIEQKGAA